MIRRIVSGLGISTAIILVTMVGQIIAVPILLSKWGAQSYGEWLTLTNLGASLSVLNLGVQTYVGNQLISFYVRGELREGTRTLQSALRLYLLLCGLGLACLAALIAWPGLLPWLQIKATAGGEARIILGVQGLIGAYAILGGLLMSLFRATNQLPRQLAYSLVERIVFIGAPVGIAAIGGYPIQAMLGMVLLFAMVSAIEFRDVRRRSPYLIGISESTWAESLALIWPSLVFFGTTLATPLLSTGMTVIIASLIGATAVVIYSTTLMLTNLIRTMINQILNVLWPEITAAASVSDDSGRLRRWHRLTLKLSLGLALLGTDGVILLGPDILRLWTRGKIQIDPWLNLLLGIYLGIQAPALVSGVFGMATNRQGEIFKVQLVTVIISIMIAAWALPGMGISGAACGLILGQIVGTTWMIGLACRWTTDKWPDLLSESFVRSLVTVTGMTITSLAIWNFLPGLFSRMAGSVGLAIIASILGWRTWLTSDERNLIIGKWNEVVYRGFPKQHEAWCEPD